MKILFSILIAFYPLFSLGQVFTDGEELMRDGDPQHQQQQPRRMESHNSQQQIQQQQNDTENAGNLDNSTQFSVEQGSVDGTNLGQDNGNSVNALGLAMGATFAAMCRPRNPMACVLAAKSFADAATGRGARADAFNTGSFFDPTRSGQGSSSGGANNPFSENSEAAEGLKKLAEMGYVVNEDGSVTTPDGQTLTGENLTSAEGLQNAGLTASQAQSTMDMLGKVTQEAQESLGQSVGSVQQASVSPNPSSGDGGGMASLDSASEGSFDEEVIYIGKKKKDVDVGRMPASQAAKLKKNFNGDPIGIGMANLFLIVNQTYKAENNNNKFFVKEYGN